MAKYDNKNDTKKIKILSGVLGALLSVTIAGSVVMGVGFGKYGKDTNAWFKPGTSISQPDTPDSPDTPDVPDTPDTPDVPEVKKSTPLEVGDKLSLWEGAEGKKLYINTDMDVWKEFYKEHAYIQKSELLLFSFFKTEKNFGWGVLEDGKYAFPMYFAKDGEGSSLIFLFGTYIPFMAFSGDDQNLWTLSLLTRITNSDGMIDLSELVSSDETSTIEYVGFEGNLIDPDTNEYVTNDDGEQVTLRNIKISGIDSAMISTDWMNKLFSTTPFVK